MTRHITFFLTSCLFAQAGFAGGLSDPIIPDPVIALIVNPLDWYIGLQAGVADGDVAADEGNGEIDTLTLSGPIYGVHAGVQRRFGSVTAGIEIDYNASSVEFEDDGVISDAEMETLAHLKLRAGTDVGPAFVYGTAGLAYASLAVAAPADEASDTAPFFGFGVDAMITQNVSVGGEVLLHRFEDFDGTGADMDFTTAMLRVSYHF